MTGRNGDTMRDRIAQQLFAVDHGYKVGDRPFAQGDLWHAVMDDEREPYYRHADAVAVLLADRFEGIYEDQPPTGHIRVANMSREQTRGYAQALEDVVYELRLGVEDNQPGTTQ